MVSGGAAPVASLARSNATLYGGRSGTDEHHPGDDVGRLILEVYRSTGVGYRGQAVQYVLAAYQRGYNREALRLGTEKVTWEALRSGVGRALAGATDEEEDGMVKLLQ